MNNHNLFYKVIDMFLFIVKGMRSGISNIANRYGKTSDKYMKNYYKDDPSKYVMYLDANSLCGYVMLRLSGWVNNDW